MFGNVQRKNIVANRFFSHLSFLLTLSLLSHALLVSFVPTVPGCRSCLPHYFFSVARLVQAATVN